MSLSDFARLSNKDLQLYKQLNDLSYKSVNGKRQDVRNFREGVVDIGKIHFNQPKDVLTKDMILEFQKEQENQRLKTPGYIDPVSGDDFKYTPTGLNDALEVFTPKDLTLLGTAATETDIQNKEQELSKEGLELKKIDKEIAKNLIDERKAKEKIMKLEVKLQELQKEFDQLNAKKARTTDAKEIKIIDGNINKTKAIINDYFKYDKLRDYLDTLDNVKIMKFHNINIHIYYNTKSTDHIDYDHINKILKRAYIITQFIVSYYNFCI